MLDGALSVLGLGWLGTVLGICGLIFGFFTYVWARRRTRLAYVYVGEHLLGSASDALPAAVVVQYEGISIPRLTKTQVIIWNSGENTISGTDIVHKDPLRLQVGDDGKILSVLVLKTSRDVIDFKLAPNNDYPHQALLTFDYLDANDGVVVEILHTSTDRKPRIAGTLKGLPKGFSNYGQFTRPKPPKKSKNRILSKVLAIVFSPLFLLAVGFLCAIYGPRPSFLTQPENVNLLSGLAGGAGGLFAMWAFTTWDSRRKYPKSLNVDALE